MSTISDISVNHAHNEAKSKRRRRKRAQKRAKRTATVCFLDRQRRSCVVFVHRSFELRSQLRAISTSREGVSKRPAETSSTRSGGCPRGSREFCWRTTCVVMIKCILITSRNKVSHIRLDEIITASSESELLSNSSSAMTGRNFSGLGP